jgi:hypothetical protein
VTTREHRDRGRDRTPAASSGPDEAARPSPRTGRRGGGAVRAARAISHPHLLAQRGEADVADAGDLAELLDRAEAAVLSR